MDYIDLLQCLAQCQRDMPEAGTYTDQYRAPTFPLRNLGISVWIDG